MVVHSRSSAKVFHDTEARSIRVAVDHKDRVWVGHKHSYELAVDEALIMTLYDDRVPFRVWDTKDRVSSRARFDRPKPTVVVVGRPRTPDDTLNQAAEVAPPQQQQPGRGARASVGRTAGGKGAGTAGSAVQDAVQEEREHVAEENAAVLKEITALTKYRVAEDGTGALLQLDFRGFFSGQTTVVEMYKFDPASSGLENLIALKVTMTLDAPLLSPLHQRRLKPLRITVEAAHCLPQTPVSYAELTSQCMPPFVNIEFNGLPTERLDALAEPRGISQGWQRSFVVLLGRFDEDELRQYFKNGQMQIELHDRDRKPHDVSTDVIFAAGQHGFADFDEAVGLSLDTPEHSIFNPYGVVQVSLSDILTGTRKMRMECGVLPCVQPSPAMPGASSDHVAGMDIDPVHAGHYMEAGSYLVVGLELVLPFKPAPRPVVHIADQPFLQAVFVFETRGSRRIMDAITRRFQAATEAAVAGNAGGVEGSEMDDVLTGVVFVTPARHVVIVEGLAGSDHLKALLADAEQFPPGEVAAIFNTSLRQKNRTFLEFGTELKVVLLPQPIEQLLQKAELYIRESRGWECRSAMSGLQGLEAGPSMEQISVGGMVPSPAEVCAIDNTYGCSDPSLVYPEEPDPDAEAARSEMLTRIGRKPWLEATSKVDAANRDYERVLSLSPERRPENFVRKNIARAKSLSPTKRVGPPEDVVIADGDGGPVFMYSSQAKNCVELATMKLTGYTASESGAATSTSFWSISRVLVCPPPPHPCRASVVLLCVLFGAQADWVLFGACDPML